MNNPYTSSRLRKLRRVSKLRYIVSVISALPEYIMWRVRRMIPEAQLIRLSRRFGVIAIPFTQLIQFLKIWIGTRFWRKLLWVLPLLLFVIWLVSSLFLVSSQTDEEFYKVYRKKIMMAAAEQDYDLAGFLCGKLINLPAFKSDKELLHIAMIVADQNKNHLRVNALKLQLTSELEYAPSHMWAASKLLSSQSNDRSNIQRAVEHIKTAISLNDSEDEMKVQLVNIYFQQGRYPQAISLLGEIETSNPAIEVLQGRLYRMNGEKQNAYRAVMNALEKMDNEDPNKEKYVKDRLDALTVLLELGGESDFVRNYVQEVIRPLKDKKSLYSDDVNISNYLTRSFILLGRVCLLEKDEVNRRKALAFFEKAIGEGEVPYNMGAVIFSASNLDSSGGLTEQQMRDALVNGDGVAVAHVFLGLDAWKKDLMDDASFHFRIAYAIQPNSLRLVEFVAIHIAQASKEGTLSPFRLSLENEPLWRRSLRLLKISSEIDAESFERNLYAQCLILSNRQRWPEVPILVEQYLDGLSDEYRSRFLQLLIRSYSETRDQDQMRKYSKLLQSEIEANRR